MIAVLRRLHSRVRAWLAADLPDRDTPEDRVW